MTDAEMVREAWAEATANGAPGMTLRQIASLIDRVRKEERERRDIAKRLLDEGWDAERLDYDVQAVNQAHRVLAGGEAPRSAAIRTRGK